MNNNGSTAVTWIEVGVNSRDESIELEAYWDFSAFHAGVYSGPVEACSPAEGGELQECIVILPDGTVIDNGESYLTETLGGKRFEQEKESAFIKAESEDWRY